MPKSSVSIAKRMIDALAVLVIHMFIASVVYMILLYVAKMMWSLFIETPVGQHHNELFPDRAEMLHTLFFSSFHDTAFQVMTACLVSGLAITAAGRFIHLYRLFYRSLDVISRTLLWGVPVAFTAAQSLVAADIIRSMGFALAFALFPSLAYTRIILRFNSIAVPEAGTLFSMLRWRSKP